MRRPPRNQRPVPLNIVVPEPAALHEQYAQELIEMRAVDEAAAPPETTKITAKEAEEQQIGIEAPRGEAAGDEIVRAVECVFLIFRGTEIIADLLKF